MYNTDKKQLRAFARKMRDRGSAGFAAGPWSETEEAAGMTTDHAIPGAASDQDKEGTRPAGNVLDRLLAGIAIVSSLIVVAGGVAIYLSHEPAGTAPPAAALDAGEEPAAREPLDKQLPTEAPALVEDQPPATREAPAQAPGAADRPLAGSAAPEDVDMQGDEPATIPVGQGAWSHIEEVPVPTPDVTDQPPAASAVPDDADMHGAEPGVTTAVDRGALPPAGPLPEAREAAELQPAPAAPAVAVQEAAEDTTPPAPPAAAGWVVNLASYANEKTADRTLEEFRQQGVVAESITVTVRGKPMHRLRVTGFGTRQAAEARADALREQLGLDGIWVTKR